MHDHLGHDGEQLFVKPDVAHERPVRVPVIQIAHVMAQKCLPAAAQGEHVP